MYKNSSAKGQTYTWTIVKCPSHNREKLIRDRRSTRFLLLKVRLYTWTIVKHPSHNCETLIAREEFHRGIGKEYTPLPLLLNTKTTPTPPQGVFIYSFIQKYVKLLTFDNNAKQELKRNEQASFIYYSDPSFCNIFCPIGVT